MSGDPTNANIWGEADVYVGPLDATNPATIDDDFDEDWGLVGLLDGDAGFEEDRSRDSSDFFAWGQLLIRTSRRNFALTRKFTALESNAVVAGLVWPGSGPGQRMVPKANASFKIAFQTWDGDIKKRVISSLRMEVEEVGAITDKESDLTKYEITVKIYPTAEGQLWDVQGDDELAGGVTLVSIATNATKAVAVGAWVPMVITANYSDSSTADVSDKVRSVSSVPAKAAVDGKFINGVAAGASNVTFSYGGQNFVCAVTVS